MLVWSSTFSSRAKESQGWVTQRRVSSLGSITRPKFGKGAPVPLNVEQKRQSSLCHRKTSPHLAVCSVKEAGTFSENFIKCRIKRARYSSKNGSRVYFSVIDLRTKAEETSTLYFVGKVSTPSHPLSAAYLSKICYPGETG